MRSVSLMLLVFAATLTQGPALLAAQRPSEMALYGGGGEIDRFLSPNELQLAELQRERQDLLKSRSTEKNARILKNKITILNNKITFLQRQIKLTNPYMVTQRLVPISVKGAQSAQRLEPVEAPTPAPAVVVRPAPVPIAVPVVVKPKTFSVSEKREDVGLGVLPRKLDSKSLTVAAPRAAAEQKTLPIRVTPRPFTAAAGREIAATQTLPIKLALKPVTPVSQRAAAQEQAVPAVEHKPGSGKTGANWKKMELADKEIYILSVMGSLSRRDVYLMKPYSFYIQSIDKAIENDPRLEQEFVHRILMSTAYDSEPDTRKDLEKVWK